MKTISGAIIKYISIGIIGLSVASCGSYKKHLKPNETLYDGSTLTITDSFITKEQRKELETTLKEAVRPNPNKKILGMRYKLFFFNLVDTPKKEKGLKYSIKYKLGEPPVLGQEFNGKQNSLVLANILQNNGYLFPQISSSKEVDSSKQLLTGHFDVQTGKQYKLRSVEFLMTDSSQLSQEILSIKDSSLLKVGDPYKLENVEAERERIDNYLKNHGYYYFNTNYLLARVDTGTFVDSVDVQMILKKDIIPDNAYHKYTINQLVIQPNYQVSKNNTTRRAPKASDTTLYRDYIIVDRRVKKTFKPYIFDQTMQLRPGEYYSRLDQNVSLNRLVSLNTFKFVKNELTPAIDTTGNSSNPYGLNLTYLLTPYTKQGLNVEVDGFSQNDSRLGSRLSLNWKNRNIFRGGEQLNIKASGGFEMQYGGSLGDLPNLYNFGLEGTLNIPRFLLARELKIKQSSVYIPKTIIKAGYNFYNQAGVYTLNTFNLSFGYNWKEDARREHKLYPINITYVRTDTLNKTTDFNISNILFNGVIIGPTYEYTYNSTFGKDNTNRFYFNGLGDLSCNILGLIQGTSLDKEPEKIFGAKYAQYAKIQGDFRYYKSFNKGKNMWANRVFLGYGYAYGNSSTMPNVKQFFVGGAGSLRGFRSRYLGPGAFHNGAFTGTGSKQYIELLGDAKLELSTEWRQSLYSSWLKGAAFIDAGNIWLNRKNENFPGGEISKNFLNQMAVSTGVGLRFDFSIIVLRLDFGMPIRKPWMEERSKWVFDQIDFGDKAWRKENIIFNLAIGYPF